ncbi:hypothetical protein QUB20_05150, partial [Microcoleus sp. B4-C2]|uniref:hypothetical protein n=1 Tax=Microcoleus sp. B4-C2 TaxID=2818661 RepID=UPI002FD67814
LNVLVEQAGKPVLENGSTNDYKLNCVDFVCIVAISIASFTTNSHLVPMSATGFPACSTNTKCSCGTGRKACSGEWFNK